MIIFVVPLLSLICEGHKIFQLSFAERGGSLQLHRAEPGSSLHVYLAGTGWRVVSSRGVEFVSMTFALDVGGSANAEEEVAIFRLTDFPKYQEEIARFILHPAWSLQPLTEAVVVAGREAYLARKAVFPSNGGLISLVNVVTGELLEVVLPNDEDVDVEWEILSLQKVSLVKQLHILTSEEPSVNVNSEASVNSTPSEGPSKTVIVVQVNETPVDGEELVTVVKRNPVDQNMKADAAVRVLIR